MGTWRDQSGPEEGWFGRSGRRPWLRKPRGSEAEVEFTGGKAIAVPAEVYDAEAVEEVASRVTSHLAPINRARCSNVVLSQIRFLR